MKEKLEKELENIQKRIFMINMIDTWSDEDRKALTELFEKEKEIKEKLKEM